MTEINDLTDKQVDHLLLLSGGNPLPNEVNVALNRRFVAGKTAAHSEHVGSVRSTPTYAANKSPTAP